MKQYLELLNNITTNGVEKESGRENMPNTIAIHGTMIKHDLKNGLPLLTTKKMFYKGIIHELLWFIGGETNIKYLVDNKVNIWNQDAYRWYLKHAEANGGEEQNGILHKNDDGSYRVHSLEEFVSEIKLGNLHTSDYGTYKIGDLGKVYGYQWRNQNGVDQIKDIVEGLKKNPYSRYHIIDGWNKADFSEMALPPCHLLYQFCVRPMMLKEKVDWLNKNYPMYELGNWTVENFKDVEFEYNVPKFYIDLCMFQRSCDSFLGVPYNLVSMSLLLQIMAKASNMIPGEITWMGGDTHLYVTHDEQVKTQLGREPFDLPEMKINKDISTLEDIENLKFEDFELVGYKFHPAIKAELSTGLKKK